MSNSLKTTPLFAGEHSAKLDSKSRFLLPAEWRSALGETFAFGFDPRTRRMIAAPFSSCEAFMKAHDDIIELVAPALDYGHMGKDGRIQIPPKYRENFLQVSASAQQEMALEGKGSYIKLQSPLMPAAQICVSEADDYRGKCVEIFTGYLDL